MNSDERYALFERANDLNTASGDGEPADVMLELYAMADALERALQYEPDGPCERYARASGVYARILRETGRDDQTPRYYEACNRFAQNVRTRAIAALSLGRYWLDNQCCERGLAYIQSRDTSAWSPELRLRSMGLTASFYTELGQLERGREISTECLALARAHGFAHAEAMALHELGISYYFGGDYERALPFLEECRRVATTRFRSPHVALSSLHTVGYCLIAMRRFDELELCLLRIRESARVQVDVRLTFYAPALEMLAHTVQAKWARVLDLHAVIMEEFGDHVRSHPSALLSLPHALASVFARAEDPVVLELVEEGNGNESVRDEVFVARLAMWAMGTQEDAPEYERNLYVSARAYDALTLVRAGDDPPEGDWNGLEAELLRAARGLTASSVLRVRGAFEAVSLDGTTWLDLSRKQTGRVFLRELVQAWPRAVDAWVLHDALWPDAQIEDTSALNRLYAVVYRLRSGGLEGAILSTPNGYRLASRPVRIEHAS